MTKQINTALSITGPEHKTVTVSSPSWYTIRLSLQQSICHVLLQWRKKQAEESRLRHVRRIAKIEGWLLEIADRLDWSARTDLGDEAHELRAIISDCSKDKAQAEDRLTEVLDYLDPDEFYGSLTPRPQVPEGAGLAPAADLAIVG